MTIRQGGRRSPFQKVSSSGLLANFDLTAALDPSISFSRTPNGTAGYFDSTGLYKTAAINVPRFTYNPGTLVADGLYIEEAKNYLFTKSEKFDDAAWTKSAATATADQIAAPDGLTTGDLIKEDATAAVGHFLLRAFTGVVSNAYTIPFFAKAKERSRFGLILRDTAASANQGRIGFNLGSGTVDFAAGALGTYATAGGGIRQLPNGWYFCWLTVTIGIDTAVEVRAYMLDGVATIGSPAYNGDGTSGLYFWGANPVQGSMPVSYLAADAATVSRSNDLATVSNISWLNKSAGTIFIECVPYGINTSGNNQALISLSDNTTNNYLRLRIDAAGQIKVDGNGGTPWNSAAIGAAIVPFATQKLAFSWDASSASISRNGAAAVGSGAAFALPAAISQMDIGNLAGSFFLNGTLRNIRIWNYRKPDAELALLSA